MDLLLCINCFYNGAWLSISFLCFSLNLLCEKAAAAAGKKQSSPLFMHIYHVKSVLWILRLNTSGAYSQFSVTETKGKV